MILTLPDPIVCVAIACCAGPDDIASARNAAAAIREQCGESELTRLLDRLAEQLEWAQAAPEGEPRIGSDRKEKAKMPTDKEIVEAMARAICASHDIDPDALQMPPTKLKWEMFENEARRQLYAIRAYEKTTRE